MLRLSIFGSEVLTLLKPQFYPPYRRAAPLPKRSALIPIGFHLIMPTDYFHQSFQKKTPTEGDSTGWARSLGPYVIHRDLD